MINLRFFLAMSIILSFPNTKINGSISLIVSSFIFENLFKLKIGMRFAKKHKSITPAAQISTAVVCIFALKMTSGAKNPRVPVRCL
jgi:hypothetical protein